jgi:hypothetical protein
MVLSIATPNLLQDPGYLLCAPPSSTLPTNTVAGGVFTDSWDVAWLLMGATADGSEFSDATTVSPISVAEFLPPVAYRVTEQRTDIAFALANFTLTNYKRARNGGAAALTATSGSGATALYDFTPPTPGSEVRMMIGWESLDHTVRLILPQVICGGEIKLAFKKAPAFASIPCVFSAELPLSGPLAGLPYKMSAAGSSRG